MRRTPRVGVLLALAATTAALAAGFAPAGVSPAPAPPPAPATSIPDGADAVQVTSDDERRGTAWWIALAILVGAFALGQRALRRRLRRDGPGGPADGPRRRL